MPRDISISNQNFHLFCETNTPVSQPDASQENIPDYVTIKTVSDFPQKRELLFTASDGKTYNFKEFAHNIISKLDGIIYEFELKNLPWYVKVSRMYLPEYKEETASGILFEKLLNIREKIDNADNIETLFKELTGVEYSQENMNRLINQKIQFKISDEVFALANKKTDKTEIAPIFTEDYYKSENKNIKLNNNEKEIYNNLLKVLENDYQNKLTSLLKQGKLTTEKDENGLTILENLNKIITTPRIKGIEPSKILKECLDVLENPSIITQNAEDIPEEYQEEIINKLLKEHKTDIQTEYKQIGFRVARTQNDIKENPTEEDLKEYLKSSLSQRNIGTCAAASIEYDLASKYTAEFIRMVEGLTSVDLKTTKKVNISNPYIKNFFETRMKLFKANYTITDNNNAEISLNVDNEAINLAKIQSDYKDKNERSIIDILTQSMIMNLGSANTYNSLTDKRAPSKFSQDDGGLTEIEVYFVKEVLTGNTVFNSIYKEIGDKNINQLKSKEEIKEELTEALNNNENIIIGYIFDLGEGNYSGHEITLIGQTQSITGERYFICQDSDDNSSNPVSISEDFILENIHHASFADKKSEKSNKAMTKLQASFPMFDNNPFNYNENESYLPQIQQFITNPLYIDNNPVQPLQPMTPITENGSTPLFIMPFKFNN